MADDDAAPRAHGQGTMEALGGPMGIAEASLPAAAFAAAYAISGEDLDAAVTVAIALAVVFTITRLARGQSPLYAFSGLIGVGFAAFIATRSDKAENFFLPGLLANAAYASAFLISLAVQRPLVGVIIGTLDGEGDGWRREPQRYRVFARATWLWAGVFLARLVVQLPLYLAGAVVALGFVKTGMGLPLFALALFLTYRLIRQVPRAGPTG